jgi:hypothetical protein
MKAKDYNGTIKVYNEIPKSYGNIIGGFDLLSDDKLEEFGFFNVVTPEYNSLVDELGDIYFDADNNFFTYEVNSKTWSESLSEIKENKISFIKSTYGDKLSNTDWYVIRSIEKGIAIPQEIIDERDALRAECDAHEANINSKTTKRAVVSYEFFIF